MFKRLRLKTVSGKILRENYYFPYLEIITSLPIVIDERMDRISYIQRYMTKLQVLITSEGTRMIWSSKARLSYVSSPEQKHLSLRVETAVYEPAKREWW